jgi:4,5-dihydroxyphthalate decarboxylase
MTKIIRLHLREPTIDTNRPIADGTVPIKGFEMRLVGRPEDADAWDCGFAARMASVGENPPCVSIPAFPNRKFRQSYVYVNERAGIEAPRDLERKRVGIYAWANTAGIWARGALQDYYGVELGAIHWVAARADSTRLPRTVTIDYLRHDPQDPRDPCPLLDSLLVSGEIDAMILPDVPPSIVRRDNRTRRLFRDYKSEEQAYFRKTGIFPISHVITLREEFVERHPDAPVALLTTFRRARDIAIENICGSDPQVLILSWVSHLMDEQRALMGDQYFAYDLDHNRTTLEAMMRFAHAQFLTRDLIDFRDLFEPTAMAFPGA